MSGSTAAKAMVWALRGTKADVGSVLERVQRGINAVPALAKKVEKGAIIGDPHVTKRKDGSTDPLHVSGLLGKGNLKRSNRATSFHYYIETGDLVFSNSDYPTLRIAESADGADAIPAHQKASEWVWDEQYSRYRYYDGQKWVWQEGGEGSGT